MAAHAYSAEAIAVAVANGVRSIEHGNLLDAPTAALMDPSVLWGGPDRRAVFQGGVRVAEHDARLML